MPEFDEDVAALSWSPDGLFVDALRERGRTVENLLFDGEGHEVRGVANRVRFVDEVVRWVSGPPLDAPVAIRAG